MPLPQIIASFVRLLKVIILFTAIYFQVPSHGPAFGPALLYMVIRDWKRGRRWWLWLLLLVGHYVCRAVMLASALYKRNVGRGFDAQSMCFGGCWKLPMEAALLATVVLQEMEVIRGFRGILA
jgi:hypothetical protein